MFGLPECLVPNLDQMLHWHRWHLHRTPDLTGYVLRGLDVRGDALSSDAELRDTVFIGCHFDGPERVYRLDLPSSVESLTVKLESCEDSWLLWYRESNECPSEDTLVTCSYATRGSFNVQYEYTLAGETGVVWFVVEGFQNDGGNFALHVDCFDE